VVKLDPATIRALQAAVVTQDNQPAIDSAQLAAAQSQSVATADEEALLHDEAQAASTAANEAAAGRQLAADEADLTVATAKNQAAQDRLAVDRSKLRGLAVAVYTGALTSPEPASLYNLQTAQDALSARAEVEVVAGTVVSNLDADTLAAAAAGGRYQAAQGTVASDQANLVSATSQAAAAAALVPPATAQLAVARQKLNANQRHLAAIKAALAAALKALLGSASAAGVSILGPPALDAGQLVSWYNAQGFADLTSTSITQLAAWYIQAGKAEGVRGDIAFAQAVLETGGFSSPDAVNLNNYAGIGHCDSCASGWAFPSAHAGVIGHLQLLRIFADPGEPPAGAPQPVLAALTPANQSRSGCCQTWESLTGVWATDPLYAVQILSMYAQMVSSAVNPARPVSATGN
jgi:Mannosyl-glycoprotein endo-beta-N-acetylglucosaminidase